MGTAPQQKRRRRRRKDPTQMEFDFDTAGRKFRAAVLLVVNQSTVWRRASIIATAAGITYKQTIFALVALHNEEKIARRGRKGNAMWGPLAIDVKPETGFDVLQSLFNASVKRD